MLELSRSLHKATSTSVIMFHLRNKVKLIRTFAGTQSCIFTSSKNSKLQAEEWVRDQHGHHHLLARENEKFEKYFALQNVCDTTEEWQQCLDYMRKDLPQTFRINSTRPIHEREKIETFLRAMPNLVEQNSWQKSVWHCKQSRWEIKEKDSDDQKRLFEFLKNGWSEGSISRQELVSMIPVFLLDPEPHHRVLDMCASPGSKTKHALEIMQAKEALKNPNLIPIPSGFVLANEIDVARCDKLVQNVQHFNSPCGIFVSHDGQHFPDFFTKPNRYLNFMMREKRETFHAF